ncbi:1-deoxy-D-xylulose-5-phosphate synthase [Chitinivibrio alkaliphilus]|uniref:1-deoxy-D-xylulose-5-phosphate synthase n=1 Tax=Chitinivibrio alkaliphilus ACht1 TaxID=1313304 RepID=U7DEF3_9BACT|nr:1-deoxy-D-xylulose-5-phosphate synthase [Chitinivibrio alkaliphilus]ERP39296.1 1-deoxy-D-xylulose-5-phosphate synthase [Chitinivibrio alkaliphilus ACht1]
MSLLDTITSPQDLKELSTKDLPALATEIREFLIHSVSKTGGHIAPSLGVVELTLALHYLFDSPKDKFIWDVGHQAYTHKIITGRKEQFFTLRQYNGISGFPHITESPHDALTVGHASTSISASLGMAFARDLRKETHNIVSVIGDGAMTGGLAYEGLNNLGHSNTNMIVILNDNEMSIAPNVGGMSTYLTKIITDKRYTRLKSNIWNTLDQIPASLGKKLQHLGHSIDDNLKKAFTPGKLFEDMGIKYLGPIDGHNFEELFHVLTYARDENKGPLLIHTLTKKGKGYEPAEINATKFHGIGSFDIESGEVRKESSQKTPSWSSIFGSTLLEIARKDARVLAITAAMPNGTGLETFEKELPQQLIDVGIAEQHGATFSAGLALAGQKPVFALYSSFLQRAFDQIIHDIALEKLNVVFAIDRAGLVGADGPTHHGAFDLSYLTTIPNCTILTPSSAEDLKDMLYSALYEIEGPVFIRYPRGTTPAAPPAYAPQGKKEFLPQQVKTLPGAKVLLLPVGDFLPTACAVQEKLHSAGILSDVTSLRCVKPLPHDRLYSLFSAYDTVITLENNSLINGAGAQLLQVLQQGAHRGALSHVPKLLSYGYPDRFIDQGTQEELLQELGLAPDPLTEKIIQDIRA